MRFTYAGQTYEGEVTTNSMYPTIGSMYTVYLGVQDKTSIDSSNTVTFPAIKMSVDRVVVVKKKH